MRTAGDRTSFFALRGFLLFGACLNFFLASGQAPSGGNAPGRWQLPFERRVTEGIEFSMSHVDSTYQSGLKPFHRGQFPLDSVDRLRADDRRYFNEAEVRLFRDHMFRVEEDGFTLYVDAILDLELGFDLGDTSDWTDEVQPFNNTRGAAAYGRIGKHVSFHATVLENQSQFPLWLFQYTDSLQVIPGQGRFKELESNGRDYNSSTGIITVEARPWLLVNFGHGKHFIGHGYRSMLLSDVAFNYPFIRLEAQTNNRKLRYVNVNAELQSLQRLPLGDVPESLFERKGFTFRYLSWVPHPRVEIGLYEGLIYERWNAETGTQSYPWTFAQPLPFLASAVHGLSGNTHAVVGANLKLKVSNTLFLYGQYIIDDVDERFHGYQAGLVWRDLGLKGLTLRLEHNSGGAGVFTHESALQNYSHMNQGLAHPLGTNFKEHIVVLQHQFKRFWSEWRGIYQLHDGGERGYIGADAASIDAAPHLPGTTMISDLRLGYTINPTSNMQAILGWTWRDRITSEGHLISSMYYLGFRIALFNRYYDV